MKERLQDKIDAIHATHTVSLDELLDMQSGLRSWPHLDELLKATEISVLRTVQAENGVYIGSLANSVVVSPSILVIDERIPGLCWSQYLRDDGRLLACGGVRHERSACPPFAPKPEMTRNTLSRSQAVVVIQAHNLTEYDHQKQLHHTLLAIERHLTDNGFKVVGSGSAGPCRLCEPGEECLGQGECRQPRLRRFSMEGSGMAVFLTCDRIAQITGNDSWQLKLIKNWEIRNQSSKTFKSVVAIAVS